MNVVGEQEAVAKRSGLLSAISIALCTYNGEAYLSEQLLSFVLQTRMPDELVVCDDRSSDRTIALVEAFAKDAPFPVRLFVNDTNLGSTRNFQRAISLCSGDLVFLSDQDDVWRNDKVEVMSRVLEANPRAGAVFSDAEVVGEDLRPLGYRLWASMEFNRRQQSLMSGGRAFEVFLKQNVATGAAMAFRSWLVKDFTPIPPSWIHDGWIAAVASLRSEVVSVSEPLIRYRQHGKNQIGGLRKSLGGEFAYAQEIGAAQYDAVAAQYRALKEWLSAQPDVPARQRQLDALTGKIAHIQYRGSLPRKLSRRVFPVLRTWLAGDYRRFSRGWKSFLKDLLCPAV